MSKKKAQDLIYGVNYQKFNALKQQLQRQNLILLKERQRIECRTQGYSQVPSQNTIIDKNELSFQENQEESNFQLPRFQVNQKSNPINERKKIQQQINKRGQLFSDDIIEMIDNLQSKALMEIQSLRKDKISLLKILNKQIKSHNKQKIQKIEYQKKAKALTQKLSRIKVKSQPKIKKNIPNTIYQQDDQNSPSPQASYIKTRHADHPAQQENLQQNHFQNQQETFQPNMQAPQPFRNTRQYTQQRMPQQRTQQSLPRAQYPVPLANQNVIPSQSFYYVGKNPHTSNVNQQQHLQNQLNRIRQQNIQMKNNLIRHNPQTKLQSNKNILRNELKDLQGRAYYYEQLIANAKNNKGATQRFDGGQMQTLLLQGANLAQQGQRLMKVKSNPQLSINTQPQIFYQPFRNQRPNFTQIQSNTRIERQVQTPINYSKNTNGYNNNNSKFLSGDYEKLIQNMKRAAYS